MGGLKADKEEISCGLKGIVFCTIQLFDVVDVLLLDKAFLLAIRSS